MIDCVFGAFCQPWRQLPGRQFTFPEIKTIIGGIFSFSTRLTAKWKNMRYQLELEIDRPRDRVLALFLDPENLPKWQSSIVSFEHLEGPAERQVGSKSRQIHKMGGRVTEMIETITAHDWPERFSATYEGDGIWNHIENRFFEVDGQKTRWTLDAELECSGAMVKFFMLVLPGMIRRNTMDFMKRFKDFAESSDG